MARKAFKFLFLLGLGAFLLNFAGNYFLIPIWGGLGAAFVVILSNGFINIASWLRILYSTK
jgi:O-antigen/teichoic acid export membrane protein